MLWTSNNYHDLILFRYKIEKQKKKKKKLLKYIRKPKKYKLKRKLRKVTRYKKKIIKNKLYKKSYFTILKLRLKQKKKLLYSLGFKPSKIIPIPKREIIYIANWDTKIRTTILSNVNKPRLYLNSMIKWKYTKYKSKVWIFRIKIRKKKYNKYKKPRFKLKKKKKYFKRQRAKGFLKTTEWMKTKYLLLFKKFNITLKKKLIKKIKKKNKKKKIKILFTKSKTIFLKKKNKRIFLKKTTVFTKKKNFFKKTKLFLKKTALYLEKFILKELRYISEPLITFSPDRKTKRRFWEKKLLLEHNPEARIKKKKVSKSFFKKKKIIQKKKTKKKKKPLSIRTRFIHKKTRTKLFHFIQKKLKFGRIVKKTLRRRFCMLIKAAKSLTDSSKKINFVKKKNFKQANSLVKALKKKKRLKIVSILIKKIMLKVPSSIEKIKYVKFRKIYKLHRKRKTRKINFFLKKKFKLRARLTGKKYFISLLRSYFIRYLGQKQKNTRRKRLLSKDLNKKFAMLKNYFKKFKKPKQLKSKIIYYINSNHIENINSNKKVNNFNINNYLFLNKFSLENYTQKFYLFKKKIKKKKKHEGKTFFFNFRNKKLKTYRMARKTHWSFFTNKTLKGERYQKFLNIFLKKTKNYYFDVFNYFQFKFKFSYQFWSNFSLLYKNFYNLKISYKKIFQLPLTKDFWKFIIKYSFNKRSIDRKIRYWQEKKIKIRKTFWMQQKKRIPKFFKKKIFNLPGQTNTIQYDFITNYFIILKKSLNPTHTNMFIFKNKFLKLHGFKYNS